MAGKLVAALAKAKTGLDNAAQAAAKQARRIQVTPPVGGIGHPSAKGVYRYVDGLSSPKISISDDGLVNLELPPSYRLDPEYAQTRGFRHIQELAWPYGDDEFIRVGGKNDASYLKSKTHKGSTNWHTGQPEGGLSVARDYETANDTAHLVRGKVIGQGSDSEPLLDLQSVEVLGGVPETFSADRVSALMRRYNISEDDAKSVLLTQFQRGAATIGGMATAGAVGAGAMAAQQYDFGTPDYDAKVQAFNERQRSKKNFWKELKEAGAYLGNAIGAGVVSEAAGDIQWVSGMLPGGQAYREGYDQFDAKTNQTKEAFYNALMKAKLTGDNRFLQEFGQQIEQAGEDFRPAVDAIKASPLYPMWQSLPEPVKKGAAIVADWLP